jgi:hypothetical protein
MQRLSKTFTEAQKPPTTTDRQDCNKLKLSVLQLITMNLCKARKLECEEARQICKHHDVVNYIHQKIR